MTEAVIGLGSNLDNPEQQVLQALKELNGIPGTRILRTSSLYSSVPVGPQDQPDFVNAVALIKTELEPEPLLDALQDLENRHRRVRQRRWGPRTLDLDVLFFGKRIIDTSRLRVPHPEFRNRVFTVIPLLEIMPDFLMPPENTPLRDLTELLPERDLRALTIIREPARFPFSPAGKPDLH